MNPVNLKSSLARLTSPDAAYRVILEPERNEPHWWAGAPSVIRTADGEFFLAARMREAVSPRGRRGYEIRILRSADGLEFSPLYTISRDQVGLGVFERPALAIDPATGLFRLYVCAAIEEHLWGILRFDDTDDLSRIDLDSLRPVLRPTAADEEHAMRRGYKDPFVIHAARRWHMFVIGHDYVERAWHFVSPDGERWQEDPHNPVLDAGGWHNCFTRPACVLPTGAGYLLVYEGSSAGWYDPSYNIATGLAYTLDLSNVVDLTPDAPLLKSTTPGDYHTWRYSHWLRVDGQIYIYAEVARPNNTNEIRLFVLDEDG